MAMHSHLKKINFFSLNWDIDVASECECKLYTAHLLMLSNHKAKIKHAYSCYKYCREDVPTSTMTSLLIQTFKASALYSGGRSNFYHDATQTCPRKKENDTFKCSQI